jgi:hypothetical protein
MAIGRSLYRMMRASKAMLVKADSYKTNFSKPIADNNALELTPNDALIISDKEGHKNIVNVDGIRTEWASDTIDKNMDMKIWQLLTPEGYKTPIEEAIEEAEEVVEPPFAKPQFLSLMARNNRYTVAEGRAYEGYRFTKRPFVPAGSSLSGGDSSAIKPTFLFYHDSHPLFFVRDISNYEDENGDNVRDGIEYEWTLDGDVVSTKPFFQMFNAESDNVVSWRESKDRTITCTATNSQGSISQDLIFKVYGAQDGSNGDNSHRALKGFYYEFDEDRFDRGKLSPISKTEDPRFANRTIIIEKINVNLGNLIVGDARRNAMKENVPTYMQKVSRYRVDGGPWKKAIDHFSGSNKKAAKLYNWENMKSLGKTIELTRRGGKAITFEFEITGQWLRYRRNWLGIKYKDWFRFKTIGKKVINVSTNPDVTVQKYNIDTSTTYTGLN